MNGWRAPTAREPYSFCRDPHIRGAGLGVGWTRSPEWPSSWCARPLAPRVPTGSSDSVLLVQPPTHLDRAPGGSPIGSAPVSGPLETGEPRSFAFSSPLAETARENTAPPGGSPPSPACGHESPLRQRGPGRSSQAPPRPPRTRGRCSAVSLIFMGVNREAPSISVLCGQLVGLE